MTYDDLNELTHYLADIIDESTGSAIDRYKVNDMLSSLLQDCGVTFKEDDEQ